MAIPDKLVTVAAEAYRPDCPHSYQRPSICPICTAHAKRALAAAFAALPDYINKNPPEAIVVGRHPQWFGGFDACLAYLARLAE